MSNRTFSAALFMFCYGVSGFASSSLPLVGSWTGKFGNNDVQVLYTSQGVATWISGHDSEKGPCEEFTRSSNFGIIKSQFIIGCFFDPTVTLPDMMALNFLNQDTVVVRDITQNSEFTLHRTGKSVQ